MLVGRQTRRALLLGIAAAMVAAACGSTQSPAAVDVGSGSLTGAGATFPAPFYQKAFFDYNAKYPNVTVNYQSVGSGAGPLHTASVGRCHPGRSSRLSR